MPACNMKSHKYTASLLSFPKYVFFPVAEFHCPIQSAAAAAAPTQIPTNPDRPAAEARALKPVKPSESIATDTVAVQCGGVRLVGDSLMEASDQG